MRNDYVLFTLSVFLLLFVFSPYKAFADETTIHLKYKDTLGVFFSGVFPNKEKEREAEFNYLKNAPEVYVGYLTIAENNTIRFEEWEVLENLKARCMLERFVLSFNNGEERMLNFTGSNSFPVHKNLPHKDFTWRFASLIQPDFLEVKEEEIEALKEATLALGKTSPYN